MRREHGKQVKAGGSTVLSWKKPRLLAMALLLAVLASGGFAIGEEKNVSDQARQQDAESKDIQLDGPIRPSAIITKDGVVIPKYEDDGKGQPAEKTQRQEKEKSNIVPGLMKDFSAQESHQRAQDAEHPAAKMRREWAETLKNAPKDEKGTPLPPFYNNFQIQDAKNLEPEYIVQLPEFKIDMEELRKEQEKNLRYIGAKGMPFPKDTKLNWKNLGFRIIEGKKHKVWQAAISCKNAKTIKVHITDFDTSGGAFLFAYGLNTDRWAWGINRYKFPGRIHRDKSKRISTDHYGGDTIILELILQENDDSDPNQIEFFRILGLSFLINPNSHVMIKNPLTNPARVSTQCPIWFGTDTATDPWFKYSLAVLVFYTLIR